MDCYRSGCQSPTFAMQTYMDLYVFGMRRHVELHRQGTRPTWMQHAFYRFALKFKKYERGFEIIDVISYRNLCRLMSPRDRPNMYSYGVGCHSLTFAMKAFMNLYNSLCVGMSDYIAKENGQNGCNMHFYRFALEFKKNTKEALN